MTSPAPHPGDQPEAKQGADSPIRARNPFYVILVVIGVVFAITASAYGIMCVQKLQDPLRQHPLLDTLDRSGAKILGYEIGALAIATIVAIVSDGFWMRRA